jgi:hypothetical protein
MMNYVRDCKLQGPRVDCRGFFFFFAISARAPVLKMTPKLGKQNVRVIEKCLGDLAAICFFEFASERNESR